MTRIRKVHVGLLSQGFILCGGSHHSILKRGVFPSVVCSTIASHAHAVLRHALATPGFRGGRLVAAGAVAAGVAGCAGDGRGSRAAASAGPRLHPAVHVGRAGPSGHVGPEARRAGGDPRRVQADRDQRARHSDLRALAAARPADRQAGHRPLDDAQQRRPHARRRTSCSPASRRRRGNDRATDWPHMGAVLSRLGRGRGPLPPFVSMRPKLPGDVPRFVEESHGQCAGWLGPALRPADDRRTIPSRPDYRVGEFALPAGAVASTGWTSGRALLARLDRQLAQSTVGRRCRR